MAEANANVAVIDPGVAALAVYHGKRKRDSRERLLEAALALFCERGFGPVSVDDIANAAGLSRMTLYRHFGGKGDLAAELFRSTCEQALPGLLRIGALDYRDQAVIAEWLTSLFAADRARRSILRVFIQATSTESSFSQSGHQWIAELIRAWGQSIPAFAVDGAQPAQRRRWLQAWLLTYEILDQSNHAALDSGISGDPLVIDILAERFRAFVCAGEEPAK